MFEALAFAAAIGAGALFLSARARGYVREADRRWPPIGRMIETAGPRLHVVERGPEGAPRVLLIHGASANLRELLGPVGGPLEADHRVIAFDRPGYGHSSRPRRSQTLKLQAAMAAGVLEQTGGAAIVVGHSLGAGVALRLAIERPDLVRGLVLLAPASHPYPGDNAWWARLASTPFIGPAFSHLIIPLVGPIRGKDGMANTFFPADVPEGYYEDAGVGLIFRPRAFEASARDVCATNAEFAAQAPLYPDILAPTIIITADRDRVVSPKLHARALAVELPAAELVTAPGAGHMPHRVRPDLVIAAIRRVEAMEAALAAD